MFLFSLHIYYLNHYQLFLKMLSQYMSVMLKIKFESSLYNTVSKEDCLINFENNFLSF